jgi:quercetin dioxygenase-like cupin family protein
MDPIVLRPGEGEKLDIAGNELVFKARPEETGGAYVLTDYTAGPGFPGPPPHRHREMTDAFFVLEGTLTLSLGDETIEAPAGSFVLVPPGNPHTFSEVRHRAGLVDDSDHLDLDGQGEEQFGTDGRARRAMTTELGLPHLVVSSEIG